MKASEYLEKKFGRLSFGRVLRADRLANDLTQAQLAERIGLSKQVVSAFERGKDFPSVDTVRLLAEAFQMDADIYAILVIQDMAFKKGFENIVVRTKNMLEPLSIKPKKWDKYGILTSPSKA